MGATTDPRFDGMENLQLMGVVRGNGGGLAPVVIRKANNRKMGRSFGLMLAGLSSDSRWDDNCDSDSSHQDRDSDGGERSLLNKIISLQRPNMTVKGSELFSTYSKSDCLMRMAIGQLHFSLALNLAPVKGPSKRNGNAPPRRV